MSTPVRPPVGTPRPERPEVDAPAGRLGRRRALPSGRAVAGGLLVAVAAIVVFAAWLAGQAGGGQPWIVARIGLAAGTRLAPGDLTVATITLPRSTTGAFRQAQPLVGRTLAGPLSRGDLIQASILVPAGHQPSLRPVAVAVAAADLDSLSPGQLTVVLVTNGTDPAASTSVVVRGATVLGLSRANNGLIGNQGGDVVTLGVASLSEVEAVVHAAHTGTLSVVVGEPSDGTGLGTGTSSSAAPGTSSASGTPSPGASSPSGSTPGGAGGTSPAPGSSVPASGPAG